MSSASITLGISMVEGLGTAEGAQIACLRGWPDPCMPLWLSWTQSSAPCGRTAAATRA